QATDLGDPTPGLRLFAHSDAVADRLPLRQHVVEKFIVAIDDDRPRGFLTGVVDNVALVLVWDGRLRVGQIGHELLVARLPASFRCWLEHFLHAAAERKPGNDEGNETCRHDSVTLPARPCGRPITPTPRDLQIPKASLRCQTSTRYHRKVGAKCGRNAAVS